MSRSGRKARPGLQPGLVALEGRRLMTTGLSAFSPAVQNLAAEAASMVPTTILASTSSSAEVAALARIARAEDISGAEVEALVRSIAVTSSATANPVVVSSPTATTSALPASVTNAIRNQSFSSIAASRGTDAAVVSLSAVASAATTTSPLSASVSNAIRNRSFNSVVASAATNPLVVSSSSSVATSPIKVASGLARFTVQPNGLPGSTANLVGLTNGVRPAFITGEQATSTTAARPV